MAFLAAAVEAARIWHGTHTGGPNEEDHEWLLARMEDAFRQTFQVSVDKVEQYDELAQDFYPLPRKQK